LQYHPIGKARKQFTVAIFFPLIYRHCSQQREHGLAGHGQTVPGPAAVGHIPIPDGHKRLLLAFVGCQPRAHLRARPQEPPHRAAHHGVGHRLRPGVGRLGADIPVQRGAAHTTVYKPSDPGRAHDCVSI